MIGKKFGINNFFPVHGSRERASFLRGMAPSGQRLVWKTWFFTVIICVLLNTPRCRASTKETKPHLILNRTLHPNRRVVVLDDIFSKEFLTSLRTHISVFTTWELEESISECTTASQNEGNVDCAATSGSSTRAPWIAPVDPEWFAQSKTWHRLMSAFTRATYLVDGVYYPYRVGGEMLQRGDSVAPGIVASSPYSKEYALRIFLVQEWQKDDYGDMSFYGPTPQNRTNGSEYDIMLTVRPHPGRVILWDASIPTLYRPPSMGYIQSLLSVTVHMTASKQKYKTACQEWKDLNTLKTEQFKQPFPHPPDPVGSIDVSKHLVKQFEDNKGRKVMIFDNLFEERHLEALRLYLVGRPTSPQGFNIEPYELSDNVAWLKTLDALEFPKSSAWKILSQVANYMAGGAETWFPYDVSVNVVRSADHTRVHEDCEEWEDEYTMVMYLNPDLSMGDYGETIFYNQEPLDPFSSQLYEGVSKYDYDAIGAADPKYGRVVIFNGMISHSARPPSIGYQKARYSFAIKLAANRKIAIMKKLGEILEDNIMDDSEKDLIEELYDASRKKGQTDRSEEWLEDKYRQMTDRVAEEYKQTKLDLMNIL